MGIRREVYNQLGGFSKMRFGEDIDFSIRIFNAVSSAASFLEHGFTTSGALISANSGGKSTTVALRG